MTAARTRPYQRRRRGPVLVVVVLLAVAAIATWTTVLVGSGGPSGAQSCPQAAGATGEVIPSDALADVAPLPPAALPVRVLNAGGQRGQASLVAAQLGDLGFAAGAEPGNDPLFPAGDMECYGQVRFGPAGEPAASTLSLVVPCAELVRDGRQDASVDLSVGTAFGDLNPTRASRDALEALGAPAGGSAGAANTDPNSDDTAAATPTIDPALAAEARNSGC